MYAFNKKWWGMFSISAFHVVPDVAPAAYNLLQNTTGHLLPELQELQVLQDELDDLESQLTYF